MFLSYGKKYISKVTKVIIFIYFGKWTLIEITKYTDVVTKIPS